MIKVVLKNSVVTFKDPILNTHPRVEVAISKRNAEKLKSYGLTIKEELVDFKSIDEDHKKFRKEHNMGPRDRKMYLISASMNSSFFNNIGSIIYLTNNKNHLEGVCNIGDIWRFLDIGSLKAKSIDLNIFDAQYNDRNFCKAYIDYMWLKVNKKQLNKILYSRRCVDCIYGERSLKDSPCKSCNGKDQWVAKGDN